MKGFTPATFEFLRDLARHNERAWFHANKARYESDVRDPYLRLIGELATPLAKISTHYRADPKPVGGSLFRIQRDTRFANDKTPYKTWAGARFFHERGRQVDAPLFYLQVAPGDSFVAAGLWRPQAESLRRLRAFLVDNPATWIRATQDTAFSRRFDWGGESLQRPPRGFDPQHPLIDDLKRKDFVVVRRYGDAEILAPALVRRVGEDFARMAPLVDYLCAALDLEF
jgi:uncharacterized protein (TIGR02453 family)